MNILKTITYPYKHNNLLILGKTKRNPNNYNWSVKVLCFCGEVFEAPEGNIRINHTKSCGCHRSQTTKIRNTKHNMAYTKIYKKWRGMLQRCFDPGASNYHRYGERGITVNEEWLEFECFYKDMGDLPFKNAQIDRIDNNGNYCKENCRWVTNKENSKNKRNTVKINGIRLTDIMEVCDKFNIARSAIKYRLCDSEERLRWSLDRCLKTPVKGKENIWEEFVAQVKLLVPIEIEVDDE